MEPKDVSDLAVAFGGDVDQLMPAIDLDDRKYERGWGQRLFSRLFFEGGSVANLAPKPGIDKTKALRHIRAIMGSWRPQHEHKERGCAYLLELWFEQPSEQQD